jgi:hypothetical protein
MYFMFTSVVAQWTSHPPQKQKTRVRIPPLRTSSVRASYFFSLDDDENEYLYQGDQIGRIFAEYLYQGDQIGRIFAHSATIYFGSVF